MLTSIELQCLLKVKRKVVIKRCYDSCSWGAMTLVNSRFLNVKYHQASVGKFKKVAAVSTIAFVLILVMVLTFGSTPTEKIAIKTIPAPPEPKEPGAEKHRHSFVLATNPDIPIDLALKCNTCALVSSSGMLLGSNAGSQIDSADCVFRLNSAPTLGYKRDVGSKTTIRVVSLTGLESMNTVAWQKILASFEDLDYMILLGPEELLCENCTLTNLYRRFAEYLHNTELLRVRQETYQKVKQESMKLGIKYGRYWNLFWPIH